MFSNRLLIIMIVCLIAFDIIQSLHSNSYTEPHIYYIIYFIWWRFCLKIKFECYEILYRFEFCCMGVYFSITVSRFGQSFLLLWHFNSASLWSRLHCCRRRHSVPPTHPPRRFLHYHPSNSAWERSVAETIRVVAPFSAPGHPTCRLLDA